jgi:DnaJ-related protein SCJ1
VKSNLAGMPDGHSIVFEQEGDESPDTTPGDVVFKVKTLPHKRFVRKGDDLHTQMTITLLEVNPIWSTVI